MSLRYDTLSVDELLKYGENGDIEGIHPNVAKYIRENLEASDDSQIAELKEQVSEMASAIRSLADEHGG